jgi:hypothetical protein
VAWSAQRIPTAVNFGFLDRLVLCIMVYFSVFVILVYTLCTESLEVFYILEVCLRVVCYVELGICLCQSRVCAVGVVAVKVSMELSMYFCISNTT